MTTRRSDTIDYSSQCTVCVTYGEANAENRIVYERPQMQVPDRPLTSFDRIRIQQFPDDVALNAEAHAVFADMKRQGRISDAAALRSIFIARTAVAALEMGL